VAQTDRLLDVMLSQKAKHLALAAQDRIRSLARFSPALGGQAALRFAPNDLLSYVPANKRIAVIAAIKSVSLNS
jgi:hypothetical protein